VLNLRAGGTKPDERWKKITIRHLLEHRGGWDHSSKKKVDPTFHSLTVAKELNVRSPVMPPAIIQYVLRKQLDFDPGEKFLYCNFGYLLLGRVIEKLSGKTYAEYVKKNVMEPIGIKAMKQGKTLPADRATGEVKYYSLEKSLAVMGPQLGKPVPAPYGGFCLESMDSHSAWLASASDLVKFVSHFRDPKQCKLLKPETVETMFARPEDEEAAAYYAKGWLVRPITKDTRSIWHDGSMEGTSGMVVQRADGVGFCVLFNTRQQVDNTDPAGALELHLHKVLDVIFAPKK
jgi:N-acyl-D-amino-acid deacylase